MKHDTEREIIFGEKVELNVVEFNGKAVLETEFVQYDSELCARDLKERGIDKLDFERYDQFVYDEQRNFRSVRIFHLAAGEKNHLKIGDRVRAKIESAYVAKEQTKDKIPRRKIHITVSNVMRMYRWIRRRVSAPHCLVIACFCGSRLIKKKEIPLTLKNGIQAENGQARPVAVELLPNGSILGASRDYRRHMITTGDYRLAERQKGRTMKDIDEDFLRISPHDRMIPTREHRYRARYAIHA